MRDLSFKTYLAIRWACFFVLLGCGVWHIALGDKAWVLFNASMMFIAACIVGVGTTLEWLKDRRKRGQDPRRD